MNDDVLGHLREAKAILNDEIKEGKGSREVALVITTKKRESARF